MMKQGYALIDRGDGEPLCTCLDQYTGTAGRAVAVRIRLDDTDDAGDTACCLLRQALVVIAQRRGRYFDPDWPATRDRRVGMGGHVCALLHDGPGL